MKIIFASRNKGKIEEVKNILKDKFEVLSLLDIDRIPEIEETGKTFEENAKIKAETVFNITGIPAIGDDSGLTVEQLDGKPGVFSARYAGENATDEENNNKLINELKFFSEPHHAKFVCAAVYFDGKNEFTAVGELQGRIISNPRGSNGFGYDPYFISEGREITNGELTLDEKNIISHRAIAFNKLKRFLTDQKERK